MNVAAKFRGLLCMKNIFSVLFSDEGAWRFSVLHVHEERMEIAPACRNCGNMQASQEVYADATKL